MTLRSRRVACIACVVAACGAASHAQVEDLVLTNAFFPQFEFLGGVGGGNDVVSDIDLTPDGNRMVVASQSSHDNACAPETTSGVLYIYDYNPVTRLWDEFQSIAPGCGNFGVGSTLSISDDGKTIIAGSRADNNGLVVILEEVGGTFVPTFKLDPQAQSNIGTDVDLDSLGTTAIAANSPNFGAVEFYRKSGGAWLRTQTLSGGSFNSSHVAIDNGWAMIPRALSGGSADLRFYRDNGTSFVQTQVVNVPFFGSGATLARVALNGDVLAIVTPRGGGASTYVGVRVIERDPDTDVWGEVFVDTAVDFFTQGTDVDIDGDTIVVGARQAGEVRVYERVDGQWGLSRVIDAFSPDGTNLEIVNRVGTAGGRVVYGGRVVAGTNGAAGGRAYVLEYDQPNTVGSFTEDFNGLSELPPSLWKIPRNNRTAEFLSDELVLTATVPGASDVSLQLGDFLEGDFDVSIDWEVDEVGPVISTNFLSVAELIGLVGSQNIRISRARTATSSIQPGPDYYKSWDTILGGDNLNSDLSGVTDSTAGSLRIAREGTTWRTFYRDADNPDWVQLREATLSDEPARFIFQASSNGFAITGEVRWDNLVVSVPEPCNAADLASPLGVLDLDDVDAFLVAFGAGADAADIAPPAGVLDLDDIDAFIAAFFAGCP